MARFGPYADDFRKDALMARFRPPGVPIPAVLESGETPWGYMQVVDRVHGTLLDDLDQEGAVRVLPDLLSVLDELASAAIPDREGYGLFDPDGRAPYPSWQKALLAVGEDHPGLRIHGWRDKLHASPVGTGPFDEAFSALSELVPDLPNDPGVVHQDLLHRNVFTDGFHITGIIDWGNALFGDSLYDWAWLLYWMPFHPAWRTLDVRAHFARHWAQRGQVPHDASRRLLAYQIHIGLDAQAYNAFRGRHDEVFAYGARTIALARMRP